MSTDLIKFINNDTMPRMKTDRIDEAARTLVVARRQRQQIRRSHTIHDSCRISF